LPGYSNRLKVHQQDLDKLDYLEQRLTEHEEAPTIY
jgi:hypothetical protein